MSLDLLRSVGFEPVGEWALDNGRPAPQLRDPGRGRRELYAYVSGDAVLYVGRPTWTGGEAVQGFGFAPAQVNKDESRRIIDMLFRGESLDIWRFVPAETIEYRGLPLDIGAGLKAALVSRIRPPWNDGGTSGASRRPF